MHIEDHVFTAVTEDGMITVAAAVTTKLVEEIRARHDLGPTAAAAVGRLATSAALLGPDLKGTDRLSIQIVGNGPLTSLTADVALVGESTLGVRAYTSAPQVDVPATPRGKVAVGTAVGSGRVQVTQSSDVGQPYVGIVELPSGEIEDAVAGYLLNSLQVPNIVALGALADPAGSKLCGGIIARLMPNASDEAFTRLKRQASTMSSVTSLLARGADTRDLIDTITGGRPLRSERVFRIEFACRCTIEKVETALLGLGKADLVDLAHERPQTKATCEFCRRTFHLSSEEILRLAERLR